MISRTLTGHRAHVWSMDPSIDRDHADYNWEEFLKDGEMKHLPVREGERLTVFRLAPLTRMQMMRVMEMDGMQRVNEAVAFGLRGADNYTVDGESVVLEFKHQGDERRVHEKSLNRVFDPMLFAELGSRILSISTLDPLSLRA